MKEGWEVRKLGDVCEVVNGGTPKTGVAKYWGGSHLWITPAEMGKRETPYASDTERKLTDAGLRDSSARLLPPYSVIMSSRAPIGHLVINTKPMSTNQGCKSLIPSDELEHKFLYYYLSSIIDLLNSLGTGATFKELSGGKLKEVSVPVPPYAEQRRIVAILDEAFEGLATAKANAEQNLQNARELLKSYLTAAFRGHRADAWPIRELGDVFEIGSSKRIHERDWSASGVPFYGGKEIVKLAKFGHAVSNAYISEQKYNDYASKYDMPKPGDILITARGTIGVGYVVQKSDKFYYKDGNIISMRAKEAANPHYLLYAFQSDVLADQLGDLSGTTVTHLPLEKAKKLRLRIPTINIQNAVVGRIMEFEDETRRLVGVYERKIAALNDLKQSLLHEAFAGNL